MSKYASNDNGPIYVRSEHSWGKTSEQLINAKTLADAKAKFGWTSMRYTSITVRRATTEDVERLGNVHREYR